MKMKLLRVEKNLSQADLAESVGVSVSTIQKIEAGNADPSFKVALAIKKALSYCNDNLFAQ